MKKHEKRDFLLILKAKSLLPVQGVGFFARYLSVEQRKCQKTAFFGYFLNYFLQWKFFEDRYHHKSFKLSWGIFESFFFYNYIPLNVSGDGCRGGVKFFLSYFSEMQHFTIVLKSKKDFGEKTRKCVTLWKLSIYYDLNCAW